MRLTGSFAVTSVCALLGAATPASASQPSPIWKNAKTIAVHCVVGTETTGHNQVLSNSTCAKIARLVAVDAPIPVTVIGFGDVAFSAPGTVILAVHGTVVGSGAAKSLIFTIRPSRNLQDHRPELFGSVPRMAPVNSADRAIRRALAEVLPWKSSNLNARPIR